MERIECVVVGAGVVGLALARELAMAGREVAVVEAEDRFGSGTSSRNSEVIHAGIHYPAGSLKAQLCVAGGSRLYEYCRARSVPHRRCGKLIVATGPDQLPALAGLRAQAAGNGVELAWLDRDQAALLEPRLACHAALLSPGTGIVDSHGLMQALLADAEAHGAAVVFNTPVLAGGPGPDGLELELGGPSPMRVRAGTVFNCAGLGAWAVARALAGLGADLPPIRFAKGSYFALAGPAPFSRLVYPVPEAAGLGVHLTLDLGGQARFGPDVEWVDRIDYTVEPARAEGFYAAIRRYWPELPDGALQPAFSGIRPKLQGPGEGFRDFLIQGPAGHGIQGLWNLLGIESPGLTSCLAIARLLCARAGPGLVDPDPGT